MIYLDEKRKDRTYTYIPNNRYLVDTCVWIDIMLQYEKLSENAFKNKLYNFESIENFINYIFGSDKYLFTNKVVIKELESVLNNNTDYSQINKQCKDIIVKYVKSLRRTYLTSGLKQFLINDRKSCDREIYLSGKSREIDNIVTLNKDDFKELFKELSHIYSPKLYTPVKNNNSVIFNGISEFNINLEKAKENKDESYLNLAQRLIRLCESICNKTYFKNSNKQSESMAQRVIRLLENI